MTAAAAASWYSANVYITTGAEAAVGFDAARPGAAWSVDADLERHGDTRGRSGLHPRVRPAENAGRTAGHAGHHASLSPVFVRPMWWGRGIPPLYRQGPLPYCTTDTGCSPSCSQITPVDGTDGVGVVSQMAPAAVPLYGLRPEQQPLQQPAVEAVLVLPCVGV
jgi:hypothetical protein